MDDDQTISSYTEEPGHTSDYSRSRRPADEGGGRTGADGWGDDATEVLPDAGAGLPYDVQTRVAEPLPGGPAEPSGGIPTFAVVLWTVVGVLIGAVAVLLLLPEPEATVVGADPAAVQEALSDAEARLADSQARVAELEARVAQLEAEQAQAPEEVEAAVAERSERLDEREAELNAREDALDEREAALDAREAALAEQEAQAGQEPGDDGTIPLPDLEQLDLPQMEIPEAAADQAQNALERLWDRLRRLFGQG